MTATSTDRIAARDGRGSGRVDEPRSLGWAGRVAAGVTVLVVGVLASSSAVAFVHGEPRRAVVLPVAMVVGVALAVLAVRRPEVLVLLALTVRASLDISKLGTGTGGVEPSVGLGLLVSLTALVVVAVPRRGPATDGLAPFAKALVALLAAAVISVLGARQPGDALLEVARLGSTVAMAVLLDRLVIDGAAVRRVLVAVYASALLPLAFAAGQVVGIGSPREIGGFARIQATFLHPNPFAIYCTFLVVFGVALLPAVHGWARRWLVVIVACLGVGLFLTYARGAWIAAVVGVVTVGLVRGSRKVVLAIVAVVVLVLLVVPSASARFSDVGSEDRASGVPSNSLSWRVAYWRDAVELAEQNPLSGIGIDMVSVAFVEAVPPHNDYVRVFVEMGVIGALAYLAVLGALFGVARRARRCATGPLGRAVADGHAGVVAAFVVLSLSANVLSQVVLMWYLVALTSVAVAVGRGIHVEGRHRPSPMDDRAWPSEPSS